MNTIKKQFVELYTILEANKTKKVKDILPELIALMEAKQRETNSRYDDEGNLTHVYCYYHKTWESIAEVPYGDKKSSSNGLNTMCKEGVKQWTKQQKLIKKAGEELARAKAALVEDLLAGLIDSDRVKELKILAEEHHDEDVAAAKVIIPLGE